MIDIKDIKGATKLSVPVTQPCKVCRELMAMNYIDLSWEDTELCVLPEGSYIEYGGEVWRLHKPHVPTYSNEASYHYTPRFYDKVSGWSLKPLFLVTDRGEETDWSITAYPGQLMEIITRAIKKYTGEAYTYAVDASLAQKSMESFTFQNISIFDGLKQVADKWKTDWWIDGNVIHLSKYQKGTPVTLEVGKNIGIPSVTENKDGYFTRFYAFGSTKNITQEYNDSGFTNGLVNKRLTLDPASYPGGYMDIRPNLTTQEVFVKTLIFDDVYPTFNFSISEVRGDLRDLLDESGNKIPVGEGLYQQYTVWYFKIAGFELNDTTYDPKDNPTGMLLPGLELSVIFESGQLNGREFKLTYHKDTKEYEIHFVKDGTITVPGTVTLIPTNGDKISLINIKLPDANVKEAQKRLAERLNEEMNRYRENRNSYTFPSYPVAFETTGLDLSVGQAVRFISSEGTLETRVLKVEKQLDYPIEQTITIGAEKIKGNTQEIKEEVIDANQNIDVVKTLADLNKSIQDGYGRVQQLIIESMSKYQGVWRLNQNGAPMDPTKWTVDTDYNVLTKGDLVAYATVTDDSKMEIPVSTDYSTTGLFRAMRGGGLVFDSAANAWKVDSQMVGGLDETQLKAYLDRNKYVNEQYLTDHGFMNLLTKLTGYQKITQYVPITADDTILTALGKLEGNFGNYVDLTTNQTIGGTKTFKETVYSQKDVVAYATGAEDSGLPVATDYTTTGLFRALSGGGLVYANGGWRVDPSFEGGGGLESIPISTSGSGNAVTAIAWNGSLKRLDVTKGQTFSLSGHTHDQYASSGHSHSTSSLNNDKGFIFDANGNIKSLVNSGSSRQYLAGNGQFYTIAYSELSGLPDLSSLHSHSNKSYLDVIDQSLSESGSPKFSSLYIGSRSGWNIYYSGTDLGFKFGGTLCGYFSGSNKGNFLAKGTIIAEGDVAAYSTGGTSSDLYPTADAYTYGLVKIDNSTIRKNSSGQLYCTAQGGGGSTTASYWRPSVNSNGQLSWSLSSSTSTPSAVNIKGPEGQKGQGVAYQWSGTSLRLGTINSSGSTSWGSYVNLKGEKGDTGSGGGSWNGGTISNGITISSSATLGININTYSPFINGSRHINFMVNNTQRLQIGSGGYVFASGFIQLGSSTIHNSSDIRRKNVISYLSDTLVCISSLDAFRFQFKDDATRQVRIGLSAQQVMLQYPELVFTDDKGYYALDYMSLSTIAIAGLKELYARFLPVENKVKSLEGKVDNLTLRLNNAYDEIFKLKGGAA